MNQFYFIFNKMLLIIFRIINDVIENEIGIVVLFIIVYNTHYKILDRIHYYHTLTFTVVYTVKFFLFVYKAFKDGNYYKNDEVFYSLTYKVIVEFVRMLNDHNVIDKQIIVNVKVVKYIILIGVLFKTDSPSLLYLC